MKEGHFNSEGKWEVITITDSEEKRDIEEAATLKYQLANEELRLAHRTT